MVESAVLEAAEDCVGTGRLHTAVTEAGLKRKVSYSDGEVRCSMSICDGVIVAETENTESKETNGLDEPCRCCCSSHGSTDIDKEASEFSDLEEESGDISVSTYGLESCRERRENLPLSDVIAESFDLKVTAGELASDENSSSRLFNNEAKLSASNTTSQELENLVPVVDGDDVKSRRRPKKVKTQPSNAELEDFFSATENDLMRQFTHRYNFDFVKEEPFEGRYEWVPVPVRHD